MLMNMEKHKLSYSEVWITISKKTIDQLADQIVFFEVLFDNCGIHKI